MQKIQQVLPKALQQMGIQRQFTTASILQHWKEIVGPEIFRHARAMRIENGILWVTVSHSAWSHHLHMMKMELLHKITAFSNGMQWVKDIRFTTGSLPPDFSPEEETDHEVYPAEVAQVLQLEAADWELIQQQISEIKDEQLKGRVKRILCRQRALLKAKRQLGWKKCIVCGMYCPPNKEFCIVCGLEKKEAAIQKTLGMLKEVPWLTYKDVCQQEPVSVAVYAAARQRWIDALHRDLYNGTIDDLQLAALIMLTTGKQIQEIDPTTFEQMRKKGRKTVYVPASRE